MSSIRKLTKISDEITTVDNCDNILIADSGCDQTLVTSIWTILNCTNRFVLMLTALQGRHPGQRFQVVQAAVKLTDANNNAYCAIANEALYDENDHQKESLLSTHQARSDGITAVDDYSLSEHDIRGNPGTQSSKFGGTTVHCFFDGRKCFYMLSPITDEEIKNLPHIILTPNQRFLALSRGKNSVDWNKTLTFAPQEVIDKTLESTTQIVPSLEAETRMIMRDHIKTRIPYLKMKRANDVMYRDTFFSSIVSIRGYKCFNLHCYQRSCFDSVTLMKRKSESTTALKDCFLQNGIPKKVISDNAKEFNNKEVTSYLIKMVVDRGFTEPKHPNQNLAERRGGTVKGITSYLLQITGAPLDYWCYALEYVVLIRTVLANQSIKWRTPYELQHGDTPEITRFRFIFWQPIWYYNKNATFPNHKMLKGRFLGLATNVCDQYCYLVLTRSIVRPRYRAERAPIVYTRTTDNTLVFFNNDGKTPLDTPSDCILPNIENPLLPFLEDPINNSEDSNGNDAPQLDDSFEEHIAAVIGPSNRPSKRQKQCYSNDMNSTPITAPLNSPDVELTTNTVPNTTPPPHNSITPIVSPSPMTNQNLPPDSSNSHENRNLFDKNADYVQITQDPEEDMNLAQNHDLSIQQSVSRQLERTSEEYMNDEGFHKIVSHEWGGSGLNLGVEWGTGETSFCPFEYMKLDYPKETAVYILENKVGASSNNKRPGRYLAWARSFQREIKAAVRRVFCLEKEEAFEEFSQRVNHDLKSTSDISMTNPSNSGQCIPIVNRRVQHNPKHDDKGHHLPKPKGKPGRTRRKVETKYGIRIPRNVEEALAFDKENDNNLWATAIADEINSLKKLCCFAFHSPSYKPPDDYKWTTLHMNFEIKENGRRKARLVAGGHLVTLTGIHSRSTVVRGVSVR